MCHHNYNFSQSKEQIILKLAPIAELYRQAVQKIIDPVVRELQREILSVVEASTQADYPSMLSSSNIPHFCDLLAWVSSAISSFELYFFVAKESLAVVDKLQSLRQTVNEAFNKEIHD